MQNSQKPDHATLVSLIDRLREGRFVIPDFQREFEWKVDVRFYANIRGALLKAIVK